MPDLTLTDVAVRTDTVKVSSRFSANGLHVIYITVAETKALDGLVVATVVLDPDSASALRDYLNTQLEAQ